MTHCPLPFDVVDAFTITFLKERVLTYTRTVYNPIFVLFTVSDLYPEDLGSISLRRIDDTTTDITFGAPSIPTHNEVFKLILRNNEKKTEAYQKMLDDVIELLKQNDPDIQADENEIHLYTATTLIYQKRWTALQVLGAMYYAELVRENPTLNTLDVFGTKEHTDDMAAKEARPWEFIPNNLWDRQAVKLFCQGHSNTEIGKIIKISSRRVTNRISELRKEYPFIPTAEQRRKRRMNEDS